MSHYVDLPSLTHVPITSTTSKEGSSNETKTTMFPSEDFKQPIDLVKRDTDVIPDNDSIEEVDNLVLDDNIDETPKGMSNDEPTDLVKQVMEDERCPRICCGCGNLINDPFILKVEDEFWHSGCLQCSVCHYRMDLQPSCYIKDGRLYCLADYAR